MRGATAALLAAGLLASPAILAEGYYAHPPSGREVIWPPPGGLYRSQPHSWGESGTVGPSLPALPPQRYLPSYRYRGQYINPPGPDWPDADYGEPAQVPKGESRPLPPGQPVEVVPPPGIPVEEVKQQLSRQPKRGWRPVEKGSVLPMVPEAPSVSSKAGSPAAEAKPQEEKKAPPSAPPMSK